MKNDISIHTLEGHTSTVRSLDIYNDILVSASYDSTCRIWNISEGTCLHTLTDHTAQLYICIITKDGLNVITGGLETTIRVWDIATGKCVSVLEGHTALVGQLHIQGSTLVSASSNGHVIIWSLETMSLIHNIAAHDGAVTSLQVSGDCIVSGGTDGLVKLWDLETAELVRGVNEGSDAVWKVGFGVDGRIVAISAKEGVVLKVGEFLLALLLILLQLTCDRYGILE